MCPSLEPKRWSSVSWSVLVVLLVWLSTCAGIVRSDFSFEVTHRFSEKARSELRERHGDRFVDWPAQGTTELVDLMCYRDIVRHKGRLLAAGSNLLTALDGNITYYNANDGLQYIFIEVGTPKQKFLVALDTGSDILWIPCANCTSCTSLQYYLFNPFNTTHVSRYDPSESSTSKKVACNTDVCINNGFSSSTCAANATCPYTIQYVSPARTEGYLVEDLMYLIPQKGGAATTVDIVFGCGTNQSGSGTSYDGSSIPDGLMGLGMQNISVPSTLANANIMQNSFSMCFDATDAGSGRLVFGDRGSSKAASTNMLSIANQESYYWVSVSKVLVDGLASTSTLFNAIFDTGTTLTYLETNSYNSVVNAADSQMSAYQKVNGSQLLGVELTCWQIPDSGNVSVPSIAFQFSGGSNFTAIGAFERFQDNAGVNYACLMIVDSQSSLSIIGHNFMIGKNIAFDRVSRKIKWLDTSCDNYQTNVGNDTTTNSTSPTPSPTVPTSPTPTTAPARNAAKSLLPSTGFQILCAFLVVAQLNNYFPKTKLMEIN